MRLQLSVAAQDLKTTSDLKAVVVRRGPKGQKPLGETEVIENTNSPDWTKLFIIDDFELGKPLKVAVKIQDAKATSGGGGGGGKKVMCQTMFDIGAVLGSKGNIKAKETKQGGIIMAQVEEYSGDGTLDLKLQGSDITATNPFFELQRNRETTDGDFIWDCVYRSHPSSSDCKWRDACIELSTLCSGNFEDQFRIAILDYKDNDQSDYLGSVKVSVYELMDTAESGDTLSLTNNEDNKIGTIAVVKADVSGLDDEEEEDGNDDDGNADKDVDTAQKEEENEIVVEPAGEDIPIVPIDGPSFVDYISGGCNLNVMVGIDYTASNGNPREESSLHHFAPDGQQNDYEIAISKICTILSKYDSDQKYPVWGFGAKKDGDLNQCFQCGDEPEAVGVDGILKSYKDAFNAGIAMSSPKDITEIIRAAGKHSQEELDNALKENSQSYSILLIFTNGSVSNATETAQVLDDVSSNPLSVVIVGVGSGDFSSMKFLDEFRESNKGRDIVQFVEMKEHESNLTEATLKEIPDQLVSYFTSRNIKPNPPIETDEIAVTPYSAGDDDDDDDNNNAEPQKPQEPTKMQQFGNMAKDQFMKQGTRMLNRQKQQFGRMGQQMQRKLDRMVDGKIKEMLPFDLGRNMSGGGNRQGRRGKNNRQGNNNNNNRRNNKNNNR